MQVSWRWGLGSADFLRSNFSPMRVHLFVGHDGSGLPLTILAPNSTRLLAARQRPLLIKTSGYPERQESESLRSDRDCGCQPRPPLCHAQRLLLATAAPLHTRNGWPGDLGKYRGGGDAGGREHVAQHFRLRWVVPRSSVAWLSFPESCCRAGGEDGGAAPASGRRTGSTESTLTRGCFP